MIPLLKDLLKEIAMIDQDISAPHATALLKRMGEELQKKYPRIMSTKIITNKKFEDSNPVHLYVESTDSQFFVYIDSRSAGTKYFINSIWHINDRYGTSYQTKTKGERYNYNQMVNVIGKIPGMQ